MDWKDHRIEQLERDKAELEQTIEVLKESAPQPEGAARTRVPS